MAILFWNDWLGDLRRDPVRLALAGIVVGAGCLYVGTRTPSYRVIVDQTDFQSRQAIEQVSHELAAEVDATPLPAGAQVLLRTAPSSRVVPAVALVETASGGTGSLRRVAPAGYRDERSTTPGTGERSSRSVPSRSRTAAGPVQLTGRIEVIP